MSEERHLRLSLKEARLVFKLRAQQRAPPRPEVTHESLRMTISEDGMRREWLAFEETRNSIKRATARLWSHGALNRPLNSNLSYSIHHIIIASAAGSSKQADSYFTHGTEREERDEKKG